MKIRTGFVSNSSSSSFVLVVPVTTHIKACKQLSDEDQGMMLRVIRGIKPQKVGKQDVLVITGGDYEDGWSRGELCDEDIPVPEGMDKWENLEQDTEFWDNYVKNLPKGTFINEWSDG